MAAFRIVNRLPEQAWRGFVDAHPNGNVFHTPDMFDVFARTKGYTPQLWAAVDGDDRPRAMLLPVQITLMPGMLRALTTRAVSYGSLLWDTGPSGLAALDVLLETYAQETKTAPLFTELRNLTDISAAQPILAKHGFGFEEHLNYLIDLGRTEEAIFQAFRPHVRKSIRRARERSDVSIDEVASTEGLAAWYSVLQSTYRNAHVPLAPAALFEAALEVLQPRGMIRFAQLCVGDSIAATTVELLYKNVMYGWYGGLERDFSRMRINELLVLDLLIWGKRHGYTIYDFGGAGKPTEDYGPREFKAKFGGELVNYGRNTYVGSPLRLKAITVAYELFRRLAW